MAFRTVWLVADSSQEKSAAEISEWLLENGGKIVKNDGPLTVYRSGFPLAQDSAIILICDQATESKSWYQAANSVPVDMRVVPVGGIEKAAYNDPKVVPRRVAEVNFIRPDERLLENVNNALVTPADFYETRNSLMVSAASWEASGHSTDTLLEGMTKTSKLLKRIREQRAVNADPFFDDQLAYLEEYVSQSRTFAIRSFLKHLPGYLKTAAGLVVTALAIVAICMALPILDRAAYSYVMLARDASSQLASISAIKALDGISNPLMPASTKSQLLEELVTYLDMDWCNTPVGAGYRWALNDFTATGSPHYVWSADGDGALARWDTHTGAIVDHVAVSERMLVHCAVSEDEQTLAAIDGDGRVFVGHLDGPWVRCPDTTQLAFLGDARLSFSADARSLVVYDSKTVECYSVEQDGLRQASALTFDAVTCAGFLDSGQLLVVAKEDANAAALLFADGKEVSKLALPRVPYDACGAVLRGDQLLYADEAGTLLLWDVSKPEEATYLGVTLQNPMFLAFLDDDTIAYHDRNAGTHLVDVVHRLDLGPCLTMAPLADQFSAKGSSVAAMANGKVFSQDVSNMLPRSEGELPASATLFEGTSSTGTGAVVLEAKAQNDYLLNLRMLIEGEEELVIVDGSRRTLAAQTVDDPALMEGVPQNYGLFQTLQMGFNGTITLVAATRQAEGVDAVCVGTSDGHFFEVSFYDVGKAMISASRRVPSHAAITGVYLTDECYYLRDANGLLWRCRCGCLTNDMNDLFAETSEKLTQAVGDDLLELISDTTAEKLGLVRIPGADGKVWE